MSDITSNAPEYEWGYRGAPRITILTDEYMEQAYAKAITFEEMNKAVRELEARRRGSPLPGTRINGKIVPADALYETRQQRRKAKRMAKKAR
jgi:hypothetical protein